MGEGASYSFSSLILCFSFTPIGGLETFPWRHGLRIEFPALWNLQAHDYSPCASWSRFWWRICKFYHTPPCLLSTHLQLHIHIPSRAPIKGSVTLAYSQKCATVDCCLNLEHFKTLQQIPLFQAALSSLPSLPPLAFIHQTFVCGALPDLDILHGWNHIPCGLLFLSSAVSGPFLPWVP